LKDNLEKEKVKALLAPPTAALPQPTSALPLPAASSVAAIEGMPESSVVALGQSSSNGQPTDAVPLTQVSIDDAPESSGVGQSSSNGQPTDAALPTQAPDSDPGLAPYSEATSRSAGFLGTIAHYFHLLICAIKALFATIKESFGFRVADELGDVTVQETQATQLAA
jgi:hypothetical protein